MQKNKHKHDGEEVDHEKSQATDNESGLGGLGALGAALASSLAGNAFQGDNKAFAQQGYPPQDSGSGMLGSILGALGKPYIYKHARGNSRNYPPIQFVFDFFFVALMT